MTNKPPVYNQTHPVHYEVDEISLVDLWLVLIKRKLVLISVAATCALAGLLYTIIVPPSYQYSTSIEIGTRLNGTELSVMESPETVLAKLKESYIPLAQRDFIDKYPGLESSIKIDARIPKDSQIIVLTSKGAEGEDNTHMAMQQSVVDMLKKDHSRTVDVQRKEFESLQHRAVAKLERLKKDNEALILTQKDMELARQSRQESARGAVNESKAMAFMMLDSEVLKGRQLLTSNYHAQEIQQDKIADLQIRLSKLRETRALLPPMRSPEPVGPGTTLVILLSLVLGLMLGVFAAFFAEFLSNVRSQTKSLQNA